MFVGPFSPYLGPRRRWLPLHTQRLKHSVIVGPGRVSELQVRLPGLGWPRGAVCNRVKEGPPLACQILRACADVQAGP